MFSSTPPKDPIAAFQTWLEEAAASEPRDPTAAALATVGEDGMPSVRMVLLKDASAAGFVFYTNYESRKARELEANPKAAYVSHWPALQRQIDRLVYDLYGLTDDEIRIVEEATGQH